MFADLGQFRARADRQRYSLHLVFGIHDTDEVFIGLGEHPIPTNRKTRIGQERSRDRVQHDRSPIKDRELRDLAAIATKDIHIYLLQTPKIR